MPRWTAWPGYVDMPRSMSRVVAIVIAGLGLLALASVFFRA